MRAPLALDWRVLYRERTELDKRWVGSATAGMGGDEPFEPKVMRITGHSDRYVPFLLPLPQPSSQCQYSYF